ncbi:hypothetical protein B296_00003123 [Ensete ventricosum]|uniref:Uncharacterized protein n=1 Tax=Ensete ventricosum TaxID=4639 RepID=A0A426ZHN6_ENSVE|nr:hypothetical protein B296_00003123 [Ensete ventricosum]
MSMRPQPPPTDCHHPSPPSPRKPPPPLLPALIAASPATAASTHCRSPPTRPYCSGHLPPAMRSVQPQSRDHLSVIAESGASLCSSSIFHYRSPSLANHQPYPPTQITSCRCHPLLTPASFSSLTVAAFQPSTASRHPFFLPVVQPKAAAILPCYYSHLQPCPPHLLPSATIASTAATSVAALPNCRQQPQPPLAEPRR